MRDDRRWFGRRHDKSGRCRPYREILVENAHRDAAYPGETGAIFVRYLTGPRRG